ncbi:MAG: tRNA (adenosine(37)-N6)-threonylcarbamoyltransferase complex dimerization subunit type 1 TsaB [Solirubrobacterales bacterium]|nr:tRNA (adenosine(37)-N6)-threonylcarbamoyltransferase complex dimerization subunit type 1 TsaB [Solirubrobacterales bacterium]
MKIVGFDTATDETVIAASDGGEIAAEAAFPPGEDGRPVHSETLLAAVERAVAALGGWGSVDRIAVGTGPGSYTGLRIGIASAAGLALATGKPLVGVSTLEALARVIQDSDTGTGPRPALPVLDARRGEVFAALVDPGGRVVWPPFVCGPVELGDRIRSLAGEGRPVLRPAGPGAVRFRDQLTKHGADVAGPEADIHRLDGRAVCELGAAADPVAPGATPEPVYLRVPDAQLWLERDGRDAET